MQSYSKTVTRHTLLLLVNFYEIQSSFRLSYVFIRLQFKVARRLLHLLTRCVDFVLVIFVCCLGEMVFYGGCQTHTRSMVYKKHREIRHSPVSKFFLKKTIGLFLIFFTYFQKFIYFPPSFTYRLSFLVSLGSTVS